MILLSEAMMAHAAAINLPRLNVPDIMAQVGVEARAQLGVEV